MEKSEISRLIYSFNAIKAYFDTSKRYMPQIARLVCFIEETVLLLSKIYDDIHQSANMIPTATEKLDKVTSATELAATEVMDIVDNVISRLNTMTTLADEIDEMLDKGFEAKIVREKTTAIHSEIENSQNDLFLILNALQFQDITTQQIKSIASTIDTVHKKLGDFIRGSEDDGMEFSSDQFAAFDPNAEFDFNSSTKPQLVADYYIKMGKQGTDVEKKFAELESSFSHNTDNNKGKEEGNLSHIDINEDNLFGEDGQPDINSIMNQMNYEKRKRGKL